MSVVTFQSAKVELLPHETVLAGLERAGQRIPSSCRSGVCQSCLLQVIEGDVPPQSQRGLKQTLALQGYFLACQCQPEGDLSVALPTSVLPTFAVNVLSKQVVADEVMVLRLEIPDGFVCRPGQYVHLEVEQLIRSYSIASVPERDGHIELHIRRIPGGRVSNWLHDQCQVGAMCAMRGPLGDCFYVSDEVQDFPMVLAGTGTGLAPLEGIVRDALRRGHRGPITLIHGARERNGLYHEDKLSELATAHSNFTYLQVVRDAGENGDITTLLKSHFLQHVAATTRVFLCGAPELVKRMKKQVFLLGAKSSHIYSDPFVMAPAPHSA